VGRLGRLAAGRLGCRDNRRIHRAALTFWN
jgi:hypothetical protein